MTWQEKIARDNIVLIDGAMGTEIERRGVPMDAQGWSASGLVGHEDVVKEAHKAYIRAGAEVVITNTFGTNPPMLAAMGHGAEADAINARAVALAREAIAEAADGRPVEIAGSISCMSPGGDTERTDNRPEDDVAMEGYRAMARVFREEGCDLIALEMMEELRFAPLAMEAAKESGLPVWLGVSATTHGMTGELTAFDFPDIAFADVLDRLIPMGPDAVCVMHSDIHATGPALEMVKQRWQGPLGVYPESGYFTMPTWNFVDVIAPADLVAETREWVKAGARIVGGCCGLGPEHIEALRDALPDLKP